MQVRIFANISISLSFHFFILYEMGDVSYDWIEVERLKKKSVNSLL